MEFSYQLVSALPRLAWCARVDPNSDTILVAHGDGVEARRRAFVEGAWNGRFGSFALDQATIIAGTGAILDGARVRFVAGTDHSGPLFSIRNAGALYVSNSPAFALVAADDAPDDIYPFYPYDLVRIFRAGLSCPDGQLLAHSGTSLHVHFTTILSVDRSGSTRFDSHPVCQPPHDFRSYRALLFDGVAEIVSNASDPARKRPYRPIVSLSKGYDSTAVAVAARSAGCREALTFIDNRRPDPNADNGIENARQLGMECRAYDRWQYLKLDGRADAEFGYAVAGSVIPLAAAEDQLAGSILISGEYGGVIWDPEEAKLSDRLRKPAHGYTMGVSPIEFRLRVGYCNFAPACIAARHNVSLHAIGVSEEMRPWSMGSDYERPIARRIAEEAGLPRDRFGTKKLASWHSHVVFPGRFSPSALDDYRDFVTRRHAAVARDVCDYWRARVERRHRLWDRFAARQRAHAAPASQRVTIPIRVPWPFMFTFQWTAQAMRKRYAAAALPGAGLKASGRPRPEPQGHGVGATEGQDSAAA